MATVLLEARPYRPFKSSEEYLYAMREDLAEWLNQMYPELRINVDNFMDRLDTGIALCKVRFICILINMKKIFIFVFLRKQMVFNAHSQSILTSHHVSVKFMIQLDGK